MDLLTKETQTYQNSSTENDLNKKQSHHLGALSLLCHGASLCGAEHGFGTDVQGNGHQRRTNHLLDVVDYDAMDTEILVEPVP